MAHLLAIDDVAEDFESILNWAIAFKHDSDLAPDSKPFDGLAIGLSFIYI